MSDLTTYVEKHSERLPAGTVPGASNVVFFDVRVNAEADADRLRALITAHKGQFNEVDLFDGKEHGYVELGGWLGDQEDALALIGLGEQLGLWRLLSPRTVMGDNVSADLEQQMAGAGLVSLQAVRPAAG